MLHPFAPSRRHGPRRSSRALHWGSHQERWLAAGPSTSPCLRSKGSKGPWAQWAAALCTGQQHTGWAALAGRGRAVTTSRPAAHAAHPPVVIRPLPTAGPETMHVP